MSPLHCGKSSIGVCKTSAAWGPVLINQYHPRAIENPLAGHIRPTGLNSDICALTPTQPGEPYNPSSPRSNGEVLHVFFTCGHLCSCSDCLFPPQVLLLLCIADWMVHSMWRSGKDPDSFSIPYLTALGDLLGTALLALSFHFLWVIGDRDSDVGD